MNIGINLTRFLPGQIGGQEVYVRNLLRALSKIDTENSYFIFLHPSAIDLVEDNNPRWHPIVEKLMGYGRQTNGHRTIQNRYRRAFLNRKYEKVFSVEEAVFDKDIQLWFCPLVDFRPTDVRVPSVINIPDILQDFHPDYFSEKDLMIRAETYQPSAEKATAVITYSEFSRRSLIETYHLPPEKVFMIAPSADGSFSGSSISGNEAFVKEKYGLPEEYAYYPAHGWPHKNHNLLINAFAQFAEKRGDSSLNLVLSGALWDEENTLRDAIRMNGLNDRIVILGYVEAAHIPIIMRRSKFMIFPSLFEGGAIPVIEAMSAGCPIALSSVTCLPEVAADAALYFNPTDVDDMAGAIERMDSDERLRAAKVDVGLQRAKAYSCTRTARKHLQVFEWAVNNFQNTASTKQVVLSLSDGWMENKSSIEFRCPEAARIEIALHIPNRLPLDDNRISIKCSGFSSRIRCSSGERKVVEIDLPGAPGNGIVSIRFEASKYFSCRDFGWGRDKRHLSFMIDKIKLHKQCGKEITLTPNAGNAAKIDHELISA
jgi:glycosyltransferase involved in cell wall biosynthesis